MSNNTMMTGPTSGTENRLTDQLHGWTVEDALNRALETNFQRTPAVIIGLRNIVGQMHDEERAAVEATIALAREDAQEQIAALEQALTDGLIHRLRTAVAEGRIGEIRAPFTWLRERGAYFRCHDRQDREVLAVHPDRPTRAWRVSYAQGGTTEPMSLHEARATALRTLTSMGDDRPLDFIHY